MTDRWVIEQAPRRGGPWSILAEELDTLTIGFYIMSHVANDWALIAHSRTRFTFRLTNPPDTWHSDNVFHRFRRL